MEQKKRVKFVNKDKTRFLKTLKDRVDNYFTTSGIDRQANSVMILKSVLMLSMYFLPIICF
ncbi:MAG TPA: hypothetical protein PLP14_05540, partial [Chitinophagaceae bacterium]|nr:hypothetical protein [Chitinophagaceae bacterium]